MSPNREAHRQQRNSNFPAVSALGNRLLLHGIRRSRVAAVVLLLACLLLGIATKQAIAFFPLALLMYTPISYYTDLWLYRRRLRSKARKGEKAAG